MVSLEVAVKATASGTIRIWVNGEPREIGPGSSIEDVLADLGLEADRVAVERNREIARRDVWGDVSLVPDDRLEIVHFVGGG